MILQPILVDDTQWSAKKAINRIELEITDGPRRDFTHVPHEEATRFLDGGKRLNIVFDTVIACFGTIEECPIWVPMNIDEFVEKNKSLIADCLDDIKPALTEMCADSDYRNKPEYSAEKMLEGATAAIDAMFVSLKEVLDYHNYRGTGK